MRLCFCALWLTLLFPCALRSEPIQPEYLFFFSGTQIVQFTEDETMIIRQNLGSYSFFDLKRFKSAESYDFFDFTGSYASVQTFLHFFPNEPRLLTFRQFNPFWDERYYFYSDIGIGSFSLVDGQRQEYFRFPQLLIGVPGSSGSLDPKQAFDISSDGNRVAIAIWSRVRAFDIESQTMLIAVDGELGDQHWTMLRFVDDKPQLIMKNSIRLFIYDYLADEVVFEVPAQNNNDDYHFSADGTTALKISDRFTENDETNLTRVTLIDIESSEELYSYETELLASAELACVSQDLNSLYYLDRSDWKIFIEDTHTGEVAGVIDLPHRRGGSAIEQVLLSPQGTYLAASYEHFTHVFRLKPLQSTAQIAEHYR